MIARTWPVVLLLLCGCGRIFFDPLQSDAADAGDAAASDDGETPTCTATFCDDFDRSSGTQGSWDSLMLSAGATLALSNDRAVSPPNSLLLTFMGDEMGFLVERLPNAQQTVKVGFKLSYDSTNAGTAEIDLVQLMWDDVPAGCTAFGYILVRDGTGVFDLQETYSGCGGNVDTAFDALENTGFHDVVMLVTIGPLGTARVLVSIDGTPRVDKQTTKSIPPSTLSLRLGGGVVRDVVAPWEILYDDVLVDVK